MVGFFPFLWSGTEVLSKKEWGVDVTQGLRVALELGGRWVMPALMALGGGGEKVQAVVPVLS